MADHRIRIEQHSGLGLLWVAGWLFTIGYSGLSFWWGVLAILVDWRPRQCSSKS